MVDCTAHEQRMDEEKKMGKSPQVENFGVSTVESTHVMTRFHLELCEIFHFFFSNSLHCRDSDQQKAIIILHIM